jgi:hypothetical protein
MWMAEGMTTEKCPPHRFRAGWRDDEHGVIFCTRCGEVRPLEEQNVGAPVMEQIKGDK